MTSDIQAGIIERLESIITKQKEKIDKHSRELAKLRITIYDQQQKLKTPDPGRDMANECNEMARAHAKELCLLRKYRHRAKRSYRDLQAAYERMTAKHAAQGQLLSTRTSRLAEAYRRIGIKGNEIAELDHHVGNLERSLAEQVDTGSDKVTQAERAAFVAGWQKAFWYCNHKQPGDMEACWEQYVEAKDAKPNAE